MSDTADDKVILTPDEAEGLLKDGAEIIHNFAQSSFMILGCDYDRASAIKAFKDAHQIELGGDNCKQLKHPIIVWDRPDHYTFFEADMAKVDAFEANRSAS